MDMENRRFTIQAIDPVDGTKIDVCIPNDQIVFKGSRSKRDALTIARTVVYVLETPTAIFEGMRDEKDESRRSFGWRCYCGCPPFDFKKDGSECNPPFHKVFLVFVDSGRMVYNWYWSKADLDEWDNKRFVPEDFQTRFREQVL